MDQFAALAEPNRRHIFELIATHGEMVVSQINAEFDISAPAVSQHLKVLREAGLLQMEKRAQQRVYSINPQGVEEVWQWLNNMRGFWNGSFDRLDSVLSEVTAKGEVKR